MNPNDHGNYAGDNLWDGDDEADETECMNWVNNPIRKLFDNPKSQFHYSFLEDEPDEYEKF